MHLKYKIYLILKSLLIRFLIILNEDFRASISELKINIKKTVNNHFSEFTTI